MGSWVLADKCSAFKLIERFTVSQEESYKVVAGLIVSPTNNIILGSGENTYLNSITPDNKVATIKDINDANTADFTFENVHSSESRVYLNNKDFTIETTRGEPVPFEGSISLATANTYSLIAGAGITNTGPTSINGNIATSPKNIFTGRGSAIIVGDVHLNDPKAVQAQVDLRSAYDEVEALTPTDTVTANLGGQTLYPGVYNSATSISLTGNLILDAGGEDDAVFVFQAGTSFGVAAGSTVTLVNGGLIRNVYWQVGTATSVAANAELIGVIMSTASITMAAGASIRGRLFSLDGAVTLSTNSVILQPTPESVNIDADINLFSADDVIIEARGSGVQISASSNVFITTSKYDSLSQWTFVDDGSLEFPDNTFQTTAYTGEVPGYTNTSDLKTLVAASTDFADFKSRVASQ
jgi:hypothetical protein